MPQRFFDQDFYPYFITTVVKNRRWVFQTPKEASMIGNLIQSSCQIKKFELFGYCVLPNHLHFLIQKHGEWKLPQFIQHLKGTFAFQRREGHFWQTRYHARMVNTEERLRNTVFYMKMNYQKMDLPEWYGKPPFVFINQERVLKAFGV